MSAVFLTNILSTLDQTIVGTALPKIAAQLNGYDIYAWVFAAYLLAATATVAVVGKFSDIFGRKKVILLAVATFAVGSLLCGIAWNMPALVAFRALQGIGGGGVATSTLAIISDLFPPRERAKWQTVLSLSYATSSAIGPVVGGLLTDNFSWRWIFFVNLPIATAAMLAIGFALPRIPSRGRPRIDWAGASLTVVGVLSLLLALTWGGREYAWGSWQVISLLVVAAGCGVLFPIVERGAQEAIIAPGLLRGPVTSFCCVVSFTQGFVWYGCILLAPLYLQGVAGLSATRAGGDLTPAVVLSGVAGISAGVVVARTGRYKPIIVLGGLATLVSSAWLALLGLGAAELQILDRAGCTGLGHWLGHFTVYCCRLKCCPAGPARCCHGRAVPISSDGRDHRDDGHGNLRRRQRRPSNTGHVGARRAHGIHCSHRRRRTDAGHGSGHEGCSPTWPCASLGRGRGGLAQLPTTWA